ncbi:pullulanase-type alpha-1,6-glucosidase [Biformimicrobium ophioploci]|uniref:Pullulanase-type alpha-1,6-glucosidase n=2 Tax=Biformimicrobium ophioploci TaxID=3036711 RepID=A0ABQ6M180_9GAMM|nr:pullulanase-type alpha-1,6-glucosidase [Microbulbifer sp. NKW57]
MLTHDADSDKWIRAFSLVAGDYEYKAALNGDWGENYGLNAVRDGNNIPLQLGADAEVVFIYDHETHWITDSRNSTIATVAGNFQAFLGCPGDWQPQCLRSWMQDPDGDGIYTFTTSALPAGNYEFKVALNRGWDESYGDNGNNITFSILSDNDEVYFSFDPASKAIEVSGDGVPKGDLSKDRAHWVDAHTLLWDIDTSAGDQIHLHYSADASLALGVGGLSSDGSIALTPTDIPQAVADKFPHLAGYSAFALPADFDANSVASHQLALSHADGSGKQLDATGLQLAGMLDSRFYDDGPLGALVSDSNVEFRLWAPTARRVQVRLFTDPQQEIPDAVLEATRDGATGTWSAVTDSSWDRAYYEYEVEVYSYFSRQVETNRVTDPYSLSLSENSRLSQVINLNDADLKPEGWDAVEKPALGQAEDISVYELHVRDFSVADNAVPEVERGTFAAFANPESTGRQHLRQLAGAGLTHIHLLPAFDFATVNENRSAQLQTEDLSVYAPDSEIQQEKVNAIRDADGFNWGYDPLHFTVPEGSYSTQPNGPTRIREFRGMVQALAEDNLRVVMDVVYNHTSSFGQWNNSILDKIVPGYYHRRNADGGVEMSSCCANTASEHAMMEKLMLDSLHTWATAYRVDGFRFDLMGHHTKANILNAQTMLQSLTAATDGIDGSSIYLYGEGWNFGEVVDDARFVQARQSNMAGTGVGTFNDRIRDSVRGGNPFGGYLEQGFGNGLFTDSNGKFNGDEKATLLTLADKVRISLAGNLKDFELEDASGNLVLGKDFIYNGQPTGYVDDPQESINYIAAHDNETLFDGIQIKAAAETSMEERVRMQAFSNSLVLFAQGVPFIHAGQEFLRSKSMDRDSYNSGDWFNILDFSFEQTGWGRGLPIADKNRDNWTMMQPLLADPDLVPGKEAMQLTSDMFREHLAIRSSSALFRLPTGTAIKDAVSFLNTGPDQVPGVIVMQIDDADGTYDAERQRMVVIFNGDTQDHSIAISDYANGDYALHPLQQDSVDARLVNAAYAVDTGTFTVPARTTAIFEVVRGGSNGGSNSGGSNSGGDNSGNETEEPPRESSGGGALYHLLLLLAGLGGIRRLSAGRRGNT